MPESPARQYTKREKLELIEKMTKQMKEAARQLNFEQAAYLRDKIASSERTVELGMNNEIVIKGAREHNLKNVSLTLPRDKLIVFTGLSGSENPLWRLTLFLPTVREGI